jgi:putative hydrolase of the HAD superfamily
LHFDVDNFELAQIFENQFLDEIIAYNELIEGSIEILEYLKSKNYQFILYQTVSTKLLTEKLTVLASENM